MGMGMGRKREERREERKDGGRWRESRKEESKREEGLGLASEMKVSREMG